MSAEINKAHVPIQPSCFFGEHLEPSASIESER